MCTTIIPLRPPQYQACTGVVLLRLRPGVLHVIRFEKGCFKSFEPLQRALQALFNTWKTNVRELVSALNDISRDSQSLLSSCLSKPNFAALHWLCVCDVALHGYSCKMRVAHICYMLHILYNSRWLQEPAMKPIWLIYTADWPPAKPFRRTTRQITNTKTICIAVTHYFGRQVHQHRSQITR